MSEIFLNGDWRVIVHEAEDGGYWSEIPAIPGCASDGATIEEARANAIEAAEGMLMAQLKWALSRASGLRNPIIKRRRSRARVNA